MFQNLTVNLNALCNSCVKIACSWSKLIFTDIYVGSSFQNASDLFVSCIHLCFANFILHPTPQTKDLTHKIRGGDEDPAPYSKWFISETVPSQRYKCFTRNGGNSIPKHAGPEAKGSNPTTGLTLLSAYNPSKGNFNHWQVLWITQGNETLFPNWQKESWQTFEETSRYVRPERVNKGPNSMTDIWWW